MTRALAALFRGDVAAAFSHHPLSVLLLPFGLLWAWLRWRGAGSRTNTARAAAATLAVFVAAAWVLWGLRLWLAR